MTGRVTESSSKRQLSAHPQRSVTAGTTSTGVARPRAVAQPRAAYATTARWAAISSDGQASKFGIDPAMEPPDTQVAVGAGYVVEMVNVSGAIYNKSGQDVKDLDLVALFSPDPGYEDVGDPRVIYDASSQRWFASAMGLQHDSSGVITGSEIFVAASTSQDPTQPWAAFGTSPSPHFSDQPTIGVTDQILTMAWNEYNGDPDAGGSFVGGQIEVVDKQSLIGGGDPKTSVYGPATQYFSLRPAQSLSTTSTQWVIGNNEPSSNSAAVFSITGTPAAGNVVISSFTVAYSGTSLPPNAPQPSGSDIDTGDERFSNAVWRDGELWTAANDGCVPDGSTTRQSCLEVLGLTTTTATRAPEVDFDYDVAYPDWDLYYPAITVDKAGSFFLSYTESTIGDPPSAAVIGWSPYSQDISAYYQFGKGAGSYGGTRWGDYSGAAIDPDDPSLVWAASEYVASGFSSVNKVGWGTAITSFRIDETPPSASIRKLPVGTTASSVTVSWSGSDASSGISSYDVRYQRAAYNGSKFGNWVYPSKLQYTTAKSGSISLAAGYEYCIDVSSRDGAGNMSDWRETCTARALDDRALSASSGWSRRKASGYYSGTYTYAARTGATLTRTGAYLDQVGIVATRCPTCGSVTVYVGTKAVGTINLHASSTQKKRLIMLPAFSYRKATVRVKTRSAKPVSIDGLLVTSS